MTEERKNQLFRKMVAWIFGILPNDDQLQCVFEQDLGMTEDEIDECNMWIKRRLPEKLPDGKTIHAQFEQKLNDCYDRYKAEWLQKRPDDLIKNAENIASIQRMFEELPGAVTDKDAAYLLRFKNPLEVVSDFWISMNGSGSVADDDMMHILWEIRDSEAGERDYELEPEYQRLMPSIQSSELTM